MTTQIQWVCSGHWGGERERTWPRVQSWRAGAKKQRRLHFTGDQMLALSNIYFPIFRGICLSYFNLLGTTDDCSIFKTGRGIRKRATIIISWLRYFLFYLQSSQCSFHSDTLPGRRSPLPSFSQRGKWQSEETSPWNIPNSPQQVLDPNPLLKKLLHPPNPPSSLAPSSCLIFLQRTCHHQALQHICIR